MLKYFHLMRNVANDTFPKTKFIYISEHTILPNIYTLLTENQILKVSSLTTTNLKAPYQIRSIGIM